MSDRAFRPVCTDQLLLCGDAVGMIDPAAGQDILNALMSGMMVARFFIACFDQPQLKNYFYTNYDQWFIAYFEDKVQILKSYYQGLHLSIFK